ncbi:MAG: CNNM domain-containing protein [Verrucomicrobiia bacterium]
MSELWVAIIIVFGVSVSFLMSGMEAGLFKLNRIRLRNLENSGHYNASILLGYLERPEQFLWTILAGNVLANFAVIVVIAHYINNVVSYASVSFWILFISFVFVFYFLCDFLPKILFRLYGNFLCLSMVFPFRVLSIILSPMVFLITRIANLIIRWTGGKEYTGRIFASREEFRFIMRESAGGLSGEEMTMIERVLDLKSVPIKHLTIPFSKVSKVDLHAPIDEVLKIFKEKGFSHLPVVRTENNKMTVIGIISLTDVLYSDTDFTGMKAAHFIKPALFLNEETKLEDALGKLQKGGRKIAIVLDSDKQEIGILSLNDILGFIFGDISL